MSLRVNLRGEVKRWESWSRSESESEEGGKSRELDPKPSDLFMVRMKLE